MSVQFPTVADPEQVRRSEKLQAGFSLCTKCDQNVVMVWSRLTFLGPVWRQFRCGDGAAMVPEVHQC